MRAVVLVGGEGTRLRPLTFTRPKPILPVGNVAMLARKLAHLAEHGVTEAVLSLGYKPDAFLNAFPDGTAGGVRLHYAVEPQPLDTAGAVRFAAEEAGFLDGGEALLAVNGDVLTGMDLSALIAMHYERKAEATIALTRVEDPSLFGVVPTHPDGRVITFVEKPPRDEAPTDWINAGAYVLEQRFFDRVPLGQKVSIERATFPLLVAEGTLFALQDPAYWIDAGIPTTYLGANLDMLDGNASLIGHGAQVSGASVERSVVGANSTVAAGATLRSSLLHDGVTVAGGSVLDHCIVGNGATIGRDCHLTGYTIVGDGEVVPDGTVADGGRFPQP
jgi:mannose-1-phosphate guanylyltransferase